MDGFISEVFYTTDKEYAFQRVGNTYNLYSKALDYNFLKSFRSFKSMMEYIRRN